MDDFATFYLQVNSITGPIDTVLSDAIREPDSVPNQTKLLWKSSNTKGGKFITLSLKTRSDILQGQALFRGVEQLPIREKKEKKKRKIEKKKKRKKEKEKKR